MVVLGYLLTTNYPYFPFAQYSKTNIKLERNSKQKRRNGLNMRKHKAMQTPQTKQLGLEGFA